MSAHTPGPWRWELNEKSKQLQLCGGVPRFDLTVMDFERWGMDSAIVRFRADVDGMNLMHHARDFAVVAAGREHHAEWFKTLNHPDANLIAACPDLLAALQRSLSWCTAAGMDGSGDCIEPEWCEQARAAIAKARGGK